MAFASLFFREQTVKSFDWADLLRHHPILSVLNADEITGLLSDTASQEHTHPPGEVIMQAGEVGDSIYLVGGGAVDAVLPLEGDRRLALSTMRKGEIFGEMAFFEGRPRSATVVVRETCLLLEIDGRQFRQLFDRHPEIEVKLLLKVSERLRNANEQILKVHLRGIDDRLKLFNDKLDVEHRIVEASLKAAQTVFDQTKLRADEVISSADRSRTRLQVGAGIIVAFFSILGFFGISQMMNLRDHANQVSEQRKQVDEAAEKVRKHLETITVANVEHRIQALVKANEQVVQVRDSMKTLLRYRFMEALESGVPGEAIEFYRQLRGLDPEDRNLAQALFDELENAILNPVNPASRRGYGELLVLIGREARAAGETRNDLWAQYLHLANGLLATPGEVDIERESRRVMAQHKEAKIPLDADIKRLKDSIAAKDPAQGKRFDLLLVSR